MDSANGLLNRQGTVHQILGGGLVADVVLWRQRNVTLGVMLMAGLVWIVFERSGYTLLSLSSSVLLLLVTILFVWSKAASLLNRQSPPLPDMYLTEESVAEVAELIRSNINSLIKVCRNVALGKDSRLFFRVATCLLLFSLVGGLTDIASLCYICLLVLLTIPAIYEKYEEHVDRCVNCIYGNLRQVYVKVEEYIAMLRKLDIEKIQ